MRYRLGWAMVGLLLVVGLVNAITDSTDDGVGYIALAGVLVLFLESEEKRA